MGAAITRSHFYPEERFIMTSNTEKEGVEMANDDGADPTNDITKQNPGAGNAADAIAADDPHKVEKLAKLGKAGEDAAEGTE